MMEYSELVKSLREKAEFLTVAEPLNIKNAFAEAMSQAADAIEELSKVADTVNDAHNEGYDVGYWAGRRDYEPKWIPVTERLPESMHEYVLCCGEKGGQFVGWVGEGMILNGKARAFQHGGKGRYITHWMPLPEPPKEET